MNTCVNEKIISKLTKFSASKKLWFISFIEVYILYIYY